MYHHYHIEREDDTKVVKNETGEIVAEYASWARISLDTCPQSRRDRTLTHCVNVYGEDGLEYQDLLP